MANVKFFKGAIPEGYAKYVPGGIYFDETTHEIRVGSGTADSAEYKAFGSHVKDVVLDTADSKVILKVSYYDTDKVVSLDFSDIASATDVNVAFKKLTDRLDTLEAAKPIKGDDIKIGDDNSINVALEEDITVAGISDTYGCGLIKNGNTIKAGTSLSEVLKMMLSKEVQPAAATKPTIGISKSAAANGLHEIGEVVNVGTATLTKTAGHFNNNNWTSPAQPAAAFTWSGEKMSSKLTAGATGYITQTDVASITQGTATTVKGTNTVSISASANYSAPTNKPITNIKNESDDANATWVAGTATSSTIISWTGVYPCYDNKKALGTDTMEKITLQTSATFSVSVPAHTDNDYRFYYPDGWTVSAFKVKSLDGKYYDFSAAHDKSAGNKVITVQGNDITYHYLSVKNGASDYQIILNKALDA